MIGKIVELISEDGAVFNCLITETNVEMDTGEKKIQYDYRGLFYPGGFLGFSAFWEFNENNIHEVIFEPEYQVTTNLLDISSVVKYNDENYLVVGYNVKYAGIGEGLYACLKIVDNNSFNVVHLEEKDLKLISDAKCEVISLDQRVSNVRKNLREFNSLLVIGSVVRLLIDDSYLDVTIIARNITVESERVDYLGVHPELGFRGLDKVIRFNMDNVHEVLYLGYYDDKEFDMHLKMVTDNGMQRR